MGGFGRSDDAFKNAEYLYAELLYKECSQLLGPNFFFANRKIVENKILSRFTREICGSAIDPQIYYCIPVMNRLGDLKATLIQNLTIVSNFSKVQLVINLFDKTSESFDWISENCVDWIDAGVLTVNRLEPLPFWHFSWAKNSFKSFIGDDGIYSSLDGDNYLSAEEIARTKQIYVEFGPTVVHYFSGVWGDGSSGRISVTTELYKKHAYENALFPRQFDEISFILKILNEENYITFICRSNVDIFSKSFYLREFQEKNEWSPRKKYIELGKTRQPENPKDKNYVQSDDVLKFFTSINAFYTFLNLSKNKKAKVFYEKKLNEEKQKIYQSACYDEIAAKATVILSSQMELNCSAVTTLYSVIKNDEFFFG
ncbi:hypothetical protein Thiowin_00110 [Thiorhodovibrio winogradskyi]|uniref:Glycosyltransferase 2-like domain-containing protein n=1 Tax=Thiorhodovibrio winogradskyi TaxID=77007 RepID=A0ABZ0S1F4_9GAMM